MKILFVCHGNICRSPMAEYRMKALIAHCDPGRSFEIASAATSSEEIGNPIYPPAKRKLEEHGIFCEHHTARQLAYTDYDTYDLLIGMDSVNLHQMRRIWGDDHSHKIKRLLDYTDHPREINDPWYTGNFQRTWQDIDEGCRALLQALSSSV